MPLTAPARSGERGRGLGAKAEDDDRRIVVPAIARCRMTDVPIGCEGTACRQMPPGDRPGPSPQQTAKDRQRPFSADIAPRDLLNPFGTHPFNHERHARRPARHMCCGDPAIIVVARRPARLTAAVAMLPPAIGEDGEFGLAQPGRNVLPRLAPAGDAGFAHPQAIARHRSGQRTARANPNLRLSPGKER